MLKCEVILPTLQRMDGSELHCVIVYRCDTAVLVRAPLGADYHDVAVFVCVL